MKVYLTVDEDGTEKKHYILRREYRVENPFIRYGNEHKGYYDSVTEVLYDGTIKKLTGKQLTWEDEPYEWEGETE